MHAAIIEMMILRHQGYDVLERRVADETNFANPTVGAKVGDFEI